MKNIAIFHYHLLPGGVTDVVILSSIALLNEHSELERIFLICGRNENLDKVINKIQKSLNNPDDIQKVKTQVFPFLNYEENIKGSIDPELIINEITGFCPDDTLFWVHNFQLGKNTFFTEALLRMAARNFPLLFQIHDFPECSRYANLDKLNKAIDKPLYPQGGNVRYCVINSRDYNLLKESGIKEEILFLLQNPVPHAAPFSRENEAGFRKELKKRASGFPGFDPEGKLLFYPVRTIKRKNALEGGLFVRLLEEPANLIITLPGISDTEINYSETVREAYHSGLIPGLWGTGTMEEDDYFNFPALSAFSDAVFSSAVQEGFGYLFINTLHQKKPLIARKLDILDGIFTIFDNYPACFYSEIRVPVKNHIAADQLEKYKKRLFSLDKYLDKKAVSTILQELENLFSGDSLCYSYLSVDEQIKVLEQLNDPAYLKDCRQLNSVRLQTAEASFRETSIPDKTSEIDEVFGNKAYTNNFNRILDSYQKSIPFAQGDKITEKKLIELFSRKEYLRLLYE